MCNFDSLIKSVIDLNEQANLFPDMLSQAPPIAVAAQNQYISVIPSTWSSPES